MVLNKVLDYFDGVWYNNERNSDANRRNKTDFRATFDEPSPIPVGKRLFNLGNIATLALGAGLMAFSLSSAGERTLEYIASHYLKQPSTYTDNPSLPEKIANR